MEDYAVPNFARDNSLRAAVSHAVRGGVTLALLALGAALVHATGGAGGAYTYIMVVPILVGAYMYGLIGGLSAGLVAPLLLGPWMPFEVISGTAQTTEQWLIRGLAFVLVGGIGGSLFSALYRRGAVELDAARTDPDTGLPNRGALQQDLEARLAACSGEPGIRSCHRSGGYGRRRRH